MTQAVTLAGLGSTTPTIVSPTLTSPVLGTPVSGSLVNCTDVNYTGFKNRIINGGMVIDQRNAGASVSATSSAPSFAVDRFSLSISQDNKCTIQQNAGSVTPPAGFSKYWGLTVGAAASVTVGASDYFALQHRIEGNNIADMGFGASGAATFTVSFWVRSSLTGTFGFAMQNGGQTRSYGATYTISAANTWEQKTVTVVGDTSGTWATDNTAGLVLTWGLGIGSTYSIAAGGSWVTTSSPVGFGVSSTVELIETNSATFYITGVQLEKGSTATSFDYRPYGTELQLCRRYYQGDILTAIGGGATPLATNRYFYCAVNFPVPFRATPTMTIINTINSVNMNAGEWTELDALRGWFQATNSVTNDCVLTAKSSGAAEL